MSSSIPNLDIPKNNLWKELAVKAQAGNQKAYAQLLTDITPYIKSRIAGSLANQDWIEDITQEILISVHKSLNTYSSERPFKPWLNAIIQFRRTDFLRKHYKTKETKERTQENIDIFEQSVTFQHSSGELKDIESAIGSLPEKQQKIFRMIKIEGYTAKEVAEEMEMTVSAVKVSAHRTTNKLKGMLE